MFQIQRISSCQNLKSLNQLCQHLCRPVVVHSGGGGSAGDKLADEAARMAKEMREQIKAGEELQKQQDRRLQLLRAQSDVDKQILQNAFALEDAIEKIKETAAPFQQAGLITDARTEADLKNIALLKKAAEDFGKSAGTELAASLPEATKGLTDLQQLGKDAFDSITGNLKSGIKGLIDGTKDLNDVLQDLISSLADLALNFAFNALSKSLFPGFAEGGRPDPGKISIVGEKGPELFVPDSAGTVIPNDFFDSARDSLQSSARHIQIKTMTLMMPGTLCGVLVMVLPLLTLKPFPLLLLRLHATPQSSAIASQALTKRQASTILQTVSNLINGNRSGLKR